MLREMNAGRELISKCEIMFSKISELLAKSLLIIIGSQVGIGTASLPSQSKLAICRFNLDEIGGVEVPCMILISQNSLS